MQKIKLLQFNMYLRPPPMGSFSNEYKDERLKLFSDEHLSKYDIICTQECFAVLNTRRARLINQAKSFGLVHNSLSRNCCESFCGNALIADGGLLTISRYPITERMFRPFSVSHGIEWFASKGILYTCIDIQNGLNLHVFNVHLQSSDKYIPLEKTKTITLKQIDEIVAFVEEITKKASKDWPIIVSGDFNIDTLSGLNAEYFTLQRALERISQNRSNCQDGNKTFIDAIWETNNGASIATTVPYEWDSETKDFIRSGLLSADYEDYIHDKNEINAKQDTDSTVANESFDSKDNRRARKETFWASQCLDYVFCERHPQLEFEEAVVDEFLAPSGSPYNRASDHNGISVNLSLKGINQRTQTFLQYQNAGGASDEWM